MSFRGKVALIAGGGSQHHALQSSRNSSSAYCPSTLSTRPVIRDLAREGAALALHYHTARGREQTLALREELLRSYHNLEVSVHVGDLGSAAAIDCLFADVLARHKSIDLVVNAQGTVVRKIAAPGAPPVVVMSDSERHRMLAYAVFVDEQRRLTSARLGMELAQQVRSG